MTENCPICRHLITLPDQPLALHNDNDVEYTLWCCPACQVQFWLPFKNPGAVWYEKDDRYAGANSKPSSAPTIYHRRIIAFLQPLVGRVLDVGCGTGNFLNWARNAGWQVVGIDFDGNAVKAAREFFHLPDVRQSSLEDFTDSRPEPFDLITFFDVLEHIDNHRDFFQMVKSLLSQRGYIAMSLPCRGGARFLQPHDLPPRHLSRWDEGSLGGFLRSQGFEVLEINEVQANWWFVVLKLRFRFGRFFSLDLVGRIHNYQSSRSAPEISVDPRPGSFSRRSRLAGALHVLARIKDAAIFGLPGFFLWLFLRLTGKSKITLFAIARKVS